MAVPNKHATIPNNMRLPARSGYAVQVEQPEAGALRDENRYRHLIERCPDAVFLLDAGRVAEANRAAARLSGMGTPDQLYGKRIEELLHTPQQAPVLDLAGGPCPASFEQLLLTLDGSIVEAEITLTPYLDEDTREGRMIVVRDVGTRKGAAPALRKPGHEPDHDEPDQYLRLITDSVPALIAYIDADQRYRFVNAAYESCFAIAREAVLGKPMREVIGAAAHDRCAGHIELALQGQATLFETSIETAHGPRHMLTVFTPDIGEDGQVRGFSAMLTDISGRLRDEQSLRERARQLRLITAAAPVFIAQCDRNYRITFANDAYSERFGLRATDLVGKRIPDLLGESAFERVRDYIDTAMSGTPCEHEVRIPGVDGQRYNMRLMYVPELDENGKVRGLVAAVTDVSRLRETEERLHRREREFKTLVENSPDIIARIDNAMRHLYVNPAIEQLSGLKPSSHIGRTMGQLGLPGPVVHAWEDAAHAAFKSGTEQRLEFACERDGHLRHFSGRVVPETERSGKIESVVVIAYDVTGRARMEKERDELLARERNARIQAETAARARDEFLAIVSHELRAPLNGIQSWAHVLENYVKDVASAPLAQRALAGIKTGVSQQVRLIEDLLDVTRMMSGKLRLVRQPLALLPTLQAAVESVRPLAAAKRIAITCTYRITTEQIEGDADRIQQIFWNLLSNAIKFTPDGGHVWMSATHSEREISVTVRDDGAGISPAFLPHLFDRFSQADTSSTRNHNGLGLGLFLVRHLVELHAGRVSAESKGEGTGTTFTVTFPLRARSPKYAAVTPYEESNVGAMPLPTLEGVRVLLIDDQEEARESLSVVLSSAGASVYAAPSGRDAQDWLETCKAEELPEVLVCDIAMPGEDGYSALRRLRTWRDTRGDTPLARMPALALTAFAHREDRIRALTAGFQMHVTKPVAAEELIVVIDTMVAHK